jgi:hypothetical protein
MNQSNARRRAPVIPTVSTVDDLRHEQQLSLSVTSMTFSQVGQKQSIVISETDYRGTFYAASSDPSVAQVTPTNGRGPAVGFAVIAVAAGSCAIKLTGESGRSAEITVVVAQKRE